MKPKFSSKTVDNLAKRAGYICSNPDCKASTVGPNSDPEKVIIIGEAAHIYGARPDAARFKSEMSDAARAEITNGIWLCRNCHKKIDRDINEYTSDLLFAWREEHEKHIGSELGNVSTRIQYEQRTSNLSSFRHYPPIIRRIVVDKPECWEWRLSAELLRHLNKPFFRKMKDLRNGLYFKSREHIDNDFFIDWIREVNNESAILIKTATELLDRLTKSWGKVGQAGDEDEIHHICCLICEFIQQVVEHEEKIYFAVVSEPLMDLVNMFKNLMSHQVEKLEHLPDYIDEVTTETLTVLENGSDLPVYYKKTIKFEFPDKWSKDVNKKIRAAKKYLYPKETEQQEESGCLTLIVFCILIWILFLYL